MDPETLHSQLINVFHGSMAHPQLSAARKSSYAKILSMLAQDQAQAHANQGKQPGASPGGQQAPEDAGYPVGQMQAMPYMNMLQHGAGYGMGGNAMPEPTGY